MENTLKMIAMLGITLAFLSLVWLVICVFTNDKWLAIPFFGFCAGMGMTIAAAIINLWLTAGL